MYACFSSNSLLVEHKTDTPLRFLNALFSLLPPMSSSTCPFWSDLIWMDCCYLRKLSPLYKMEPPKSLCSNEGQDMDDGDADVCGYCSANWYKTFLALCVVVVVLVVAVVVVVVIEEEEYLRVICASLLATERPAWPATTNLLVLERGSRGPSTVTLIALA